MQCIKHYAEVTGIAKSKEYRRQAGNKCFLYKKITLKFWNLRIRRHTTGIEAKFAKNPRTAWKTERKSFSRGCNIDYKVERIPAAVNW